MLPASHSSYDTYFRESLCYMSDYSWVYDFAVTKVLVEDALSRIPDSWLSALMQLTNDELNEMPFGFVKDSWPESLVTFCHRSQALHLVLREEPADTDMPQLPPPLRLNMPQKKQHEVCRLARLVHQECRALGISSVLDVGAGLGYLGRLLHYQYGLRVVGVEVDSQKVDAANRRQLACCPSDTSVTYITSKVTSGSEQSIRQSVCAALAGAGVGCGSGKPLAVCVVGLHTCGDLVPSTLELFAAAPELQALLLVPCCYHKALPGGGATRFPLSAYLQAAMAERAGAGLSRPDLLLRLASQETAARWRRLSQEDHHQHSFHVMSRAVLELHAYRAKLDLVKKKRRGVRRAKLKTTSFTDFLDDALERYEHVGVGGEDKAALRVQLEQLWLDHERQCRAAELLTALQVMMQAPAEHLVTLDRLVYLQKLVAGVEAHVVKVLDDNVSPRCLALVAHKLPCS